MAPQRYTRKSFTQEEWGNKVARDRQAIPSQTSNNTSELAIPRLLLNYFIINGHEDAACRMAKELGFVRTNRDLLDFNGLFKIAQRAKAMHLLKLGQIGAAMELVNTEFGTGILQDTDQDIGAAATPVRNGLSSTAANPMGPVCSAVNPGDHAAIGRGSASNTMTNRQGNARDQTEPSEMSQNGQNGAGGSDLHFKLLLLNLIEMIRNKNRTTNDAEFIVNLVNYTKEKLAPRALNNTTHMKQLELIMTLLLIPPGMDIELPNNLKKLYSVSLRTKIATLVNQRLLKSIYPAVTAQTKFPNLLQSQDTMDLLHSRTSTTKPVIRTNVQSRDLEKKFYNDDDEGDSSKNMNLAAGSNLPSTAMGTVSISGITTEGTSFSHSSISMTPTSASVPGSVPGSAATNTTTGYITLSSINGSSARPSSSVESPVPISESTAYLTQTRQNISSEDSDRVVDEPLSEEVIDFQFESKLSQIVKLWAWCENELHANNIGVPRVQTGRS